MADFTGQVVIVTGGAQGHWRGDFAGVCWRRGAGCRVGHRRGGWRGLGRGNEEGQIRFFEADVASDEVCAQTVGQIIEDWGRVDVLCNNVGIQPVPSYKLAHELPSGDVGSDH